VINDAMTRDAMLA